MNLKVAVLIASNILLSAIIAQDTLTKNDLKTALRVIDLSFTESEIDTMYGGVKENLVELKKMNRQQLPNHVPLSLWQMPLPPAALAGKMKKAEKPNWDLAPAALPANRSELAWYTLPQLASLIKSKKLSSVELTQIFIKRLKQYSDTLECVVSLSEELAMQQAKRADSLLAKGKYLGMLHGIPYGLKDLFAVKGTKTTWGAEPYKNQEIDEDAYVYLRLQEAGAVLVAKFTLGALAMGDRWYGGRTRNPWNLERGSSGSSAGSSAATVAGLVPFAIGTETWGSIISPATTCGATGLRPTFGRVSRHGGMVLSWSLDKIGPITRNANDAAIVFNAIYGSDENDGLPVQPPFTYNPKADPKKLRVGYAKNYFDRLDSSRNDWKALEAFRKMGIEPQPMIFPDDSIVWPFNIMDIVISAECAAAFDDFTRLNIDDEMTHQGRNDWPNAFRVARLLPAVAYINANRHRTLLMKAVNEALKDFDVIICPTWGSGNQSAITNLTGHPAICVPTGFDTRWNTPTSITLIGNLFEEGKIITAANAYQQATSWHSMRPKMFE